jgi:hypothetical protein
MDNFIVRIGIFVSAALLLLIGVGAWIDPVWTGSRLGLLGQGSLGVASLRADLGAFFLTAGGFALAAAALKRPAFLTPALALIGLAFAGRLGALATLPFEAAALPPFIAEIVMLGFFAAGRFMATTQA